MKIQPTATIATIALALAAAGTYGYCLKQFSKEEKAAQQICEPLIAQLDRLKLETGRYPETLPAGWLPSTLPSVIDAERLYTSNGTEFHFFFHCRSSFWDDVWDFDSRERKWLSYDDNLW